MIFNSRIERKLGLRYFSGGAGSSSGKTAPQMTPQQLVSLYNQTLPSTILNAASTVPSTTALMAAGAAASNPIYSLSSLQQLSALAPYFSQAGINLAGQQASGTAGILANQGQQIANAGNALINTSNPAQAAANAQAANLVNSINLNGLSGGEQNAVERSLNQSNYATGNLGLDNATNAVANAMNFGGYLSQKRAQLGSALGAASGVAANQNNIFNPITTAMASANTGNNFGLSQFNPTQANTTLSTPFSFASSFGNQLTGIGSASKGTTASSNASGGCFLTTAACEYKGLADDCELLQTLRKFRDSYVPKDLVDEYYDIGPELVAHLKKRGDHESVFDYIYDIAKQCEWLINSGQQQFALDLYQQLVTFLKKL